MGRRMILGLDNDSPGYNARLFHTKDSQFLCSKDLTHDLFVVGVFKERRPSCGRLQETAGRGRTRTKERGPKRVVKDTNVLC